LDFCFMPSVSSASAASGSRCGNRKSGMAS
jgi:hypothetical protein